MSTGRWFAAVGAAVVLAMALAACGSAGTGSTASASGALVVGAFNPFSGPDATFGPEMMSGAVPAVNLINHAGGVLGHKMSVGQYDTRGDPADAVPAGDKMVATTSNLIGVLGPSSDEALATVSILDQSHVVMFADTGLAAFDHSSYAYFWRVLPADDVKGVALALWAWHQGYKRVALVFGSDAGAQSDVPTLVSAFTKLGGQVVSNQPLALDQTSYRTEILKMMSAHPQAILTETDPQTAATFFSELQQLQGLIPFIGTEVTLENPWLKAVTGAIGPAAVARYFTGMQPYSPTSGSAYQIFHQALLASGSQVSKPLSQWATDPYTMSYYDSVNTMALAMVAANSTNPAVYNKYIMNVTAPAASKTVVYSFAEGERALKAGKQIQYIGAGGPIVFNKWHNSAGEFEAAHYVSQQTKVVGTVPAAQIAALSGL
jgi:branched-chain amino acid transport system substrate-binding protein